MSRTRRKHVVKGLSPDLVDYEWTGCGWGDVGHGKRYDQHDADVTAFDVNAEFGEWMAWREEVEK